MAPWTACSIVAAREDRATWLLLLKARLVEALRGHVEVLDLELLDAVAEDAVHLAHVDELVVDFVHAAGRIVTVFDLHLVGLVLMVERRIGPFRRGSTCHLRSLQKSPVLRVTHLDLIFSLGRDHVFKMM